MKSLMSDFDECDNNSCRFESHCSVDYAIGKRLARLPFDAPSSLVVACYSICRSEKIVSRADKRSKGFHLASSTCNSGSIFRLNEKNVIKPRYQFRFHAFSCGRRVSSFSFLHFISRYAAFLPLQTHFLLSAPAPDSVSGFVSRI